jgi:adenylosuccinate lyase
MLLQKPLKATPNPRLPPPTRPQDLNLDLEIHKSQFRLGTDMSDPSAYDNPLVNRYASREMSELWSAKRKFITWRKLWVILAEAEAELGLNITRDQIAELKGHLDDIDLTRAAVLEKKLRHDVMAHVHLFGELCPNARPIIHLGATSAYITDNTDLVLMREALELIRSGLVAAIDALAQFALRYRDHACLGFTHFQPAQLTTVGKRATLWCHDLTLDLAEIQHRLESLRCRGVKGTTGTQASFLALFDGDHEKVKQLDRQVAAKIGFSDSYPVTGQTYTRKVDAQVLDCLSGIAQSFHKFGTDLRLLAGLKEIEEPFEEEQIGSSAMAYKRNPMRAERLCGIARYVMSLQANTAQTAAVQWLERTLDDSANRRLAIPQAFLGIDAGVRIMRNIGQGLVVYPEVIRRRVEQELPFMATENILMAAVAAGADRQDIHERIRRHSVAASLEVKQHGRPNDLIQRLQADAAFARVNFQSVLDPSQFIGRAPQQVDEFVSGVVKPLVRRFGRPESVVVELEV